MTYGELFEAALACNTPEEAAEFVRREVAERVAKYGQSEAEAEAILKENLGYFAGYYDEATSRKIEELFQARHPIFGSTITSPEEAFAMGKKLASA